jgi:hypothetical protein
MHIHLSSLAEDLCLAAAAYAEDIGQDATLQQHFERAMQALYPR